MYSVLVNRLGGLNLPEYSVRRLNTASVLKVFVNHF